MLKFFFKFLLVGIFFIGSLAMYAQEYTLANFLLINPDIRSSGMGNASLATSSHANDIFNNSSKLNNLDQKINISLNYTPWLFSLTNGYSELYLAALGVSGKINKNSTVYGALRFFSFGDFVQTDEVGNIISTFTPNEYSIDLGYTRLLSEKFSIGAAFRFINSQLFVGNLQGQNYSAAQGFAFNFNFTYRQHPDEEGFAAAVAFNNIGTKLNYTNQSSRNSFIPATLVAGVGYKLKLDEVNNLGFGIDFNKLLVPSIPTRKDTTAASYTQFVKDIEDYNNANVFSSYFQSFGGNTKLLNTIKTNFGVEYDFKKVLFVRAGYAIQPLEGN